MFLSYLPEAGQYSSFFLYLRQVSSRCLVAFEQEENQRLGENSVEKKGVYLLLVANVGADIQLVVRKPLIQ